MSASETNQPKGCSASEVPLPSVRRWLLARDRPGHQPRIALYSPGMVGLGHMRRHVLIAQALAGSPLRPALLLLAEAREAGAFPMPGRVDCVTLPALRKDADGRCAPRHLGLPLRDVVALRAETIRATLRSFDPDVLIVDHLARGALGELQPALSALRAGGRTRCILGLRDVLEAPDELRREWRRWRTVAAIRAYYDAVWVYGDPAVYDLVRECRFPRSVAAKVTYTGYLDSRRRLECEPTTVPQLLQTLGLADRRLVLCLVGGGQDGGPLAEAFLQTALPPDAVGVVVTGPFMPPDVRRAIHALGATTGVKVVDFLAEPAPLLQRADSVIAMGGYNSVCDVLSFDKRALIIPRGPPRREQLLRAERLGAVGAFDVLDPSRLSPFALSEWIAAAGPRRVRSHIDVGGLARLPALLASVLTPERQPATPLLAGHRRAEARVATA
ncbi:MAG TPA: glycosyltransferase [Gemmatimonadales bacterium]